MKFLLAAAAILAAITHGHEIEKRQAGNTSKKVVCYYTNWSVYRKGLAKYTPQNINPYLCTHLVYAFGGLTDEFEVGPFDKYQDIEQGGYAKFNGLKQYNKGLKTLLAIGGWNEGSGRFSELVSVPEYRKTFIISAIRHLRRYNFDGLDLDWEYPASRDGSAPEDKENYATLVKELREAFNDEGRKVSKGKLLLTMAVPAGQNYIDKGYDLPSLTRDLDFFNILNYDYHSAYEPTVNHHAALMPAPGTSEYEWNAQLNVDWTVKYYIELGADKHKLVIGIPTYGRSFTLIDGNFTDFGASADGPGEQGKYTRENGFMAFYEVCENIASNGWEVRKPYPRRIGAYAYSGNQWVGYDDEKIVARKAEYVKEHDLGGIMFWSLDNDDFRGICNGEQYPLIEAGKKALFTEPDTSTNEARNLQGTTATTAGRGNTNFLGTRTSSRGSSRTRGSVTRTEDAFDTRTRESTRTRTQQSSQRTDNDPFRTASEAFERTRTRDFTDFSRTGTQDRIQPTSQPTGGTRSRDSTRFGGRTTQTATTQSRQNSFQESTRTPTRLSTRLQNRRRPTQSRTTTTTTTTPRPTQRTTLSRATPRTRLPGGRRRQQGNRRRQSTTTIDPLNTPAPPTTPSPVSSFTCKREGFYPNPENCHKYYWCLDSGPSGLGIVAHAFTCPSGLVFNKVIDGCDHADRAKCNTDKKGRGGGAGNTTPGSTTAIPMTTEIPTDYSYYDDYYYYDDYAYYDEPIADLPEPVEEVPNTVGRQFQNSGGNQFQGGSPSFGSPADIPEETSSSGSPGNRNRPQYTNISRDRTRAPATDSPREESPREEVPSRQQTTRGSATRPEYTSIQRQRPVTQSPPEEEPASARQTTTGGRNYVTIDRRRPATQANDVTTRGETDFTFSTEPTLEYVTLSRNRGRTTPSSFSTTPFPSTIRSRDPTSQGLVDTSTTPRYVTLERSRPTTTEETPTFFEETTIATTPAAADAGVDSGNINYEDYYYYDLSGDSESTLPDPLISPLALPLTTSTTSTTTTTIPPTTTTPKPTTTTSITTTTPRPIRTRTRVRGRPITSSRGSLPGLSENNEDRDVLSTRRRLPSRSDQTSAVEDKEVKVEAPEEKSHQQIPVVSRRPSSSSQVTQPPRRRVVVRKRVGVNSRSEQIDARTTGPVRIRTRPPTTPRPTAPPSFSRPRVPRPQSEARPTRPQSGTRPTRPQSDVRPTRPQFDNRQTRPQLESRPTQDQDDAPLRSQTEARPTRPLIVPRQRPTTTLPPVAFEEETVDPLEDELFIDTTIIPETSVRPSLKPFSSRPRPTTPAPRPTTPTPRPTTPAPRPTTPAPRPTTPAPRRTTLAPRRTTLAARPTTPAPISTTQAPRIRSRPSPRPRPRVTTPRPTTSRPRPRSPRPPRPGPVPTRAPLPRSPAPSAILSNDYYDYYYEDLDGALTGTLGQLATLTDKAVLMADGSVQCYDTGYFAHPDSCKKFISCSKTVRGLVRGWVYTCPEQLVFDPVGGMCNWAEAVDCAGK